MVDGESTLGDQVRFQKMLMGLTKETTASINPQIVNLFFPSTVQHKNGFLDMKKRGENAEKHEENASPSSNYVRKLKSWVRNGLGTHF